MKRLAFTMVEVCVSMVVVAMAAAAGGMALRKCQPAYHCATTLDDNGMPTTNTFCSTRTRKVLQADGCSVLGMNFPDIYSCQRICGTNQQPSLLETEVWISTDVWESFDLINWHYYGAMALTDDGNYYQCPITPTNQTAFYRAVDVYDQSPAQLTK